MITRLLVLSYLCIFFSCKAQPTKEKGVDKDLETAVNEILQLAVEKNSVTLDQKYVHPEFGVYDVFRLGVGDLFQHHKSISFAFPEEGHEGTMYPNFTNLEKQNILQELLVYNVKIDCGEIVWDKEGLFITDLIIYPKVSQIIKHQEDYENIAHSALDKKRSKFIEENSYRIVLTKYDIVFYLTKIEKRWYLTLFDRVTTDCSA